MVSELKYYDDKADNPPWIKALAEVRRRATREGWCNARVALVVLCDSMRTLRTDADGLNNVWIC